MTSTIEHVDELRDHWWWRPGWQAERHFYACHFTFADQPQLQDLVAEYQDALRDITGLDPIPAQWLHLTMQGIGFVDEIEDDQLATVAAIAGEKLATIPAPVVTFHRPVIRSEAIYLPAQPVRGVQAVRSAVREAIAEVLGDGALDNGQNVASYRPHVSLAYSNADQPAAPILQALGHAHASPTTVTLQHVDLLEFHRDRQMYEWVSARPLAIGPIDRASAGD